MITPHGDCQDQVWIIGVFKFNTKLGSPDQNTDSTKCKKRALMRATNNSKQTKAKNYTDAARDVKNMKISASKSWLSKKKKKQRAYAIQHKVYT